MRLPIKKTFFYTCLAIPLSCTAGSMGTISSPTKLWSVPIQGGFFVASQGKTQNIGIEGLEGNRFTVNNNSQISGLAGIGLYFNGYSNERIQLSYGADLFYLGKTSVRGDIVQENLFTNLSYKYDIQNLPLYAAVKALIYTNNPAYSVAVDAGIGPNFMWTSGYHETSLVDYIDPDDAFAGTNSTTFSATAGIGLRLNNVFAQLPVECGYRFFYLGQGNLKKNNNQYLNKLSTGDTYANALVCSVTV